MITVDHDTHGEVNVLDTKSENTTVEIIGDRIHIVQPTVVNVVHGQSMDIVNGRSRHYGERQPYIYPAKSNSQSIHATQYDFEEASNILPEQVHPGVSPHRVLDKLRLSVLNYGTVAVLIGMALSYRNPLIGQILAGIIAIMAILQLVNSKYCLIVLCICITITPIANLLLNTNYFSMSLYYLLSIYTLSIVIELRKDATASYSTV